MRTVSSIDWFHRPTWIPMWYTELPNTMPSGSKPVSRTSMNSLTERSDEKHLPEAASARRAPADWGIWASASVMVVPPDRGVGGRD